MAVLGEATVKIVPDTSGFSATLKKDVDAALSGIDKAVDQTADNIDKEFKDAGKTAEKAVGGIGDEFKKLGKLVAGAAIGKAVFGFAKSAIDAASDLGESVNAVQVTFGALSDEILAFSKTSATAVGLASADFNSFAVRFAGFTKQIATGGVNAADVTKELTTRIADFASVMNLDLNEAATVFASTLAGESEAIRRFGIDMSAASIEAFALEKGLIASKDEMTAGIKVQATYAKLMQDTSQVAGDFANTSDSLANQQRILGAQFKDLQATIGAALVPALQTLIGVVQPVFEGFMALPDPIQQVIAVAALAAGGFVALSIAIQGVGISAGVANPIILGVVAAIGAAVVVYKAFTDGNKRAKEDQERLTAALTAANDPTWTLINNIKALVTEINNLKPEDAADGIEKFAGTVGFARENLLPFLTAIEESGVGLSRIARAASSGTDAFQDIYVATLGVGDAGQSTSEILDKLRVIIEQNTRSGDPLREMLMQIAASGGLTRDEFRSLLFELDRTADAFDDNRTAGQAAAEEIVRSSDFANAYATVLGDKMLGALIDNAIATGDWTGALVVAQNALAGAGFAIDPVTGKLLSLETAEGKAALAAAGLTTETDILTGALSEQQTEIDRSIGALDRLKTALDFEATMIEAKMEMEGFRAKWAEALENGKFNIDEFNLDVIGMKQYLLQVRQDLGITATAFLNNEFRVLMDTGDLERAWLLLQAIAQGGEMRIPTGPGSGDTALMSQILPEGLDFSGFMAHGGLVNRTSLAVIGEAGPEAVIPLTRPARALELMRDSGLLALAQQATSTSTMMVDSTKSTVTIENANFYNGTDANLVAQKVNAAELARSFSS